MKGQIVEMTWKWSVNIKNKFRHWSLSSFITEYTINSFYLGETSSNHVESHTSSDEYNWENDLYY